MTSEIKAAESRAALRVDEVGARLGLGMTLTRTLIRTGEIRSFRVGRAILVTPDELARFVSERSAGR